MLERSIMNALGRIDNTIPGNYNGVDMDSNKLQPDKNNATLETTIEKINSEVDLTSMTARSLESLTVAPNWNYGTTTPRQVSGSGSGLLLANTGHIAIALPEVIQNYLYPIGQGLQQKILTYRDRLCSVLNHSLALNYCENDLLVITGPTFIKNSTQIKGCAKWIGGMLGKQFKQCPNPLTPSSVKEIYTNPLRPKHLMLSVRANLTGYGSETTDSVMTYEISKGMPYCRALLDEISEICPIVGETSDTITPQYLGDLFCLGLVSSTLVESQLHRELSSGTSYPIGFQTLDSCLPFNKSLYKHKIQSALDAMFASNQPHQFLSVNKLGTVAVAGTAGNNDTFIILEVNLQLSYEELIDLIEYKIYRDNKLQLTTPRIMLDVGKISDNTYYGKLAMVKRFMTEKVRFKIMGVLIDSGEQYVPGGDRIDLSHEFQFPPRINLTDDIEEMKKYFERNSFVQPDKVVRVSETGSYYEYFINANKFIEELDVLSSNRKLL